MTVNGDMFEHEYDSMATDDPEEGTRWTDIDVVGLNSTYMTHMDMTDLPAQETLDTVWWIGGSNSGKGSSQPIPAPVQPWEVSAAGGMSPMGKNATADGPATSERASRQARWALRREGKERDGAFTASGWSDL